MTRTRPLGPAPAAGTGALGVAPASAADVPDGSGSPMPSEDGVAEPAPW